MLLTELTEVMPGKSEFACAGLVHTIARARECEPSPFVPYLASNYRR